MNTSLEKIQLPDFILADLYKENLVILKEIQVIEKQTAKIKNELPETKWFLGDNKKNICIVVNDLEAVYLNEDLLNFLTTILGACKLNLGDVAILNYNNNNFQYSFIKEQLSPKYLLLFNIEANAIQLPFTIPYYQVQQYDKCSILTAPTLQIMLGTTEEAKLHKSRLWLSLKKMFTI